jgi:hypothetical protein
MDIQNTTQEAKPAQNTAQPPINPMQFDESALAKLLKTRFSGEEEKQQSVEQSEPEPVAASADEEQAAEPTAEETESQATEPPDEVLSESEDNDESLGFRKRIDKLTRQKKEAQEKAEALERELNEAKTKLDQVQTERPVPAVSSAQDPFADVWDDGKLNDEWTKARNLKRWCEDNSDGCEVDGKEYSAEDIKSIKRRVEDALDLHIPNRARFLQNYKQIKPIAEQLYPWWKDRASTEYTEAQTVLRQLPQLSHLPEYQVLIGDFIAGRKLRLEASKGKPAVKPIVKAPSQPGKPTIAPVKKDAAAVGLQQAKSKFSKTGSQSELAQVLKRML